MKYNLKNPLWKTNPRICKRELEKELRDLGTSEDRTGFRWTTDYIVRNGEVYINRKEIFGDGNQKI